MTPIPTADCPENCRVTETVPMAHVASVDKAAQFYSLLGFECVSRFSGHDGVTNWCNLTCGNARLMLARATGPITAPEQAVLFYMYSRDVRGLREHLLAKGIEDAGSPDFEGERALCPPIASPGVFSVVPRFFMPDGELRIHDLDGYVILVGQLKP